MQHCATLFDNTTARGELRGRPPRAVITWLADPLVVGVGGTCRLDGGLLRDRLLTTGTVDAVADTCRSGRRAARCSAPLAYRAIAYGVAANASSVIDAELLRHQQRYPTADRCIDGDAIEVTIKITSCTSDAWEKR